ncbi:MAG: toxic anion resistance protein, partial [Culicoidibacterales bacterium]
MNDKKNLNSNQMPEQVMGGIDQEQVDSMQGMNNMDPMQGMNNMNPMQGMNNMNSMQGMNNMNQMQGMNNMNQMQGMNNMDPMQGMNNMNSMQGMNNMNQMQGMNNMNQMQGMNNMNQMQGMNNMNQMQGMNNMNPMQGMNNMNPMQGMDGMNQVQVMDDMNQMPTQPQQNDFNEQTMQAYKARLRQLPEVQQLTGQIEVQNPNSIMHFGQKTSEGISKVSDELLHAMRVVKAEEANEMLVALTKIMDKFDVVELENVKSTKNTLASKLLKNVGNTVAKMFQKYDTMGYEIDKVYQLLKKYEVDIKEATVN